MSLRAFHLFFILVSIIGADLFAVWAVWHFTQTKDALILTLGVISALGGVGLLVYGIRQVRQFDAAGIR